VHFELSDPGGIAFPAHHLKGSKNASPEISRDSRVASALSAAELRTMVALAIGFIPHWSAEPGAHLWLAVLHPGFGLARRSAGLAAQRDKKTSWLLLVFLLRSGMPDTGQGVREVISRRRQQKIPPGKDKT
jgi:hypothetical protein